MSTHKTQELADAWLDRVKKEASRRNCAYDHYGTGNTPESCDPEGAAMVTELLAQHALIVQMLDELADLKSRMQSNVNGADETYFFIGLKQQISISRMERLTTTIATAEKYLGEQA